MAANLRTKFSTSTRFFSLVLEETLLNNKLRVPIKFVRTYGDTLSNRVSLKLPCGLEWEIGLTNCDGKLWLDKGWPKFAQYYSVEYGSMLVFSYQGNSKFHAFIFDKSTVEIDYPTMPTRSVKSGPSQQRKRKEILDDDDDDISVEILGGFSQCHNAGEASSFPSSCPPKRVKSNVGKSTHCSTCHLRPKGTHFRSNVRTNSMRNGASRSSNSKVKGTGKQKFVAEEGCGNKCTYQRWMNPEAEVPSRWTTNPKSDIFKRTTMPFTAEEKAKAFEKARGFRSNNPSFKIVMQPSYIHCKAFLKVPLEFAKMYIDKKECDVRLWVWDGGYWYVHYRVRARIGGSWAAELSRGWSTFMRDNALEVGDVCIFELVDQNQMSFKVSILKVGGEASD